MKHKIIPTTLICIFFASGLCFGQSIFSTKEEVADYLEGEWNVDVVHGGFGSNVFYLPSTQIFDSAMVKMVYQKTQIDSTPLLFQLFVQDTIYEESYITIEETPSHLNLPRWSILILSDNFENSMSIKESLGFYGFSQDSVVLDGGIASDGYEYGISRLTTRTSNLSDSDDINIYPNPSVGKFLIEGIRPNTSFELYNNHGKLIKSGKLSNNMVEIESRGLFILKLKGKDNWATKKIIVER